MDRFRILTLNIWNRQGPWEKRLTMIQEGIRALQPDIIGLQEVILYGDRTQADDIGEGLNFESAFGMAHDLGGGKHFGNAVLSRFPITRKAVFPLPTTSNDERRRS
jgi:endonuclease/exonuclease/phosphatase family metal-dependent hydrolase